MQSEMKPVEQNLSSQEKRNLIAAELRLVPSLSNRAVAKKLGEIVDSKTVKSVRTEMESAGQIPRGPRKPDTASEFCGSAHFE